MPRQQTKRGPHARRRDILRGLISLPVLPVAKAIADEPLCANGSSEINRGPRYVERIDFGTANWVRNEFDVEQLILSDDPVSGAVTFALRTPKGMTYPERAHFYDCDEDLFQMEGEFHHQEDLKYREGDYIYRPPGSVYGDSPGSEGGIIIAALNRKPVRYHFAENPEPWTGEYLVDRRWNPRSVTMMHVKSEQLPWQDSSLDRRIQIKPLRGTPGACHPHYGARVHSPWGADSAFMLRIQGGFSGTLPLWPSSILEVLATHGSASVNGKPWHRGCYSFGGFEGRCIVREDLILYVRAFNEL